MSETRCPTYADHEWGSRRLVSAESYPSYALHVYQRECRLCGRVVRETDPIRAQVRSAFARAVGDE